MNPIRQFLKHSLEALVPRRAFLVRGPRRDAGTVALTFDDGPHPVHTPVVLEALARAGQQATFFVIGQQADQYPELVRRIVDEGHAIGNHTWSHAEPASLSATKFAIELDRTRDCLQAVLGSRPWSSIPLMRPPKGALSPRKLLAAWQRHYSICLWNVDPRDYRLNDPEAACAWAKRTTLNAGDVVLLHDNHAAAAQIVDAWTDAGLWDRCSSVRLDHWLSARPLTAPVSITSPQLQEVAS